MRALPAAGLAGLVTGGHVSEGVIAERLEWCRGWTQQVAAQDADAQCQMLAAGCQTLQVCCRPVTVLHCVEQSQLGQVHVHCRRTEALHAMHLYLHVCHCKLCTRVPSTLGACARGTGVAQAMP